MHKFILSLLLCFSFHCSYSQWTQLTDFPGTQRDDGTSFTIGNKAYCFSGLEVGWQCTGNGFVFDASTETWSTMASLPAGKERQYATAFSYNGDGYVLGGLDANNNVLNDFRKYSVATDSWTNLPTVSGSGRQGMSYFIIKDKLYLLGGKTTASGLPSSQVWQYSFTTTNWTHLFNMPVAMWRGAAFAIDTVGYICYGLGNAIQDPHNHHIYRYDYNHDTWHLVTNVTLPGRDYIACAVVNKKALLYGGQDSLNAVTNDIQLFDPADSSLTTNAGVPTIGRKGTMHFSINDVFYVTTGLDSTQNRIKETWKNTSFVGLKENEVQLNVKVYPNPANDKLNIILNSKLKGMIQLYNQLGELVFEIKTNNSDVEINTNSFSNGIYVLTVKTQEGIYSKKLVINH